MIIFAGSLFGYMVLLIFIKWSINWKDRMQLGSCNYNEAGVPATCRLDVSKTCFSSMGTPCTAASTLVTTCSLQVMCNVREMNWINFDRFKF